MGEPKWEVDDPATDDVRALFDSRVLRVWHLEGREKTFTIESVKRLTSSSKDGKDKRQALLVLKGVPLPLALNATNRDTIIQLYGNKKSNWPGKRIRLYPTTTNAFGKQTECIRIRNQVPQDRPGTNPDTVPREREPGDEG